MVLKMPKSNTEKQADFKERKRAQGLQRHEIWCKPSQWPAIQAYCQKKAREALLSEPLKGDK